MTRLERDRIQDVHDCLSTIKQKLYETCMDLVETQRKAFRKIAMLIPPDVKTIMDVIFPMNKLENKFFIKKFNRCFFACPGTINNVLVEMPSVK